ncbi:NAC domain-containing protein [Trifolium medium]|uniref:NAC domain-containing protein n=1 Tax=Trifolium medium TaxID=97028 RepID=A0A392NC05_9FABA|nr:NAC domain-containing protein [Trifolium medium]
MAEPKLIPGFRFHPTDVELVMYFLMRKIMGRKFPFDVIAELDIYNPAGKKYSVGGRMNRATEIGYWKTTGKDRSIQHNNQLVGMIRTLVFHIGKAPKGDRTDWVMHEFRLEDKYLADKGIPQVNIFGRVYQLVVNCFVG